MMELGPQDHEAGSWDCTLIVGSFGRDYVPEGKTQYYVYAKTMEETPRAFASGIELEQLPPVVREAALGGDRFHWHRLELADPVSGEQTELEEFCVVPEGSYFYTARAPVPKPARRIEKVETDLV